MKTKVVIDRIEEDFAVIELDMDNYINVPLKYLPAGVKEGQVLILSIEEYHS
ncbi:MAG: hypothetical protein ACD_79C01155G0002 [uncultured bacterium]|nr:MAG: hypothetical protein ACD_79C01155G0002 [uncultured bacterium]